MAVRHMILLAAGEASRLEPLTRHRPKGMLLVGGKPLLQHTIEAGAQAGITDVCIVTGRHGDRVQAFFKDGRDFGVAIRYAHQDAPKGTAHAVRCALQQHLDQFARPVEALVVSGHLFLTGPVLQAMSHASGAALATSLAKTDHAQGVTLQKGSQLQGIRRQSATPGVSRASIGIVRATPALLAALRAGTEPDLDLAVAAYAATDPVQVVDVRGLWEPMVDPWDLLRVNEVALDEAARRGGHSPQVVVGPDCTIAPTARLVPPVTLGAGTSIGDFCVVGPYVSIRNACTVGAHCEVRHSILNNNVSVDSRSLVRGSILDDGARLGAGFLCEEVATPKGPRGCIVGADARVPMGSRLAGGTIVPAEP